MFNISGYFPPPQIGKISPTCRHTLRYYVKYLPPICCPPRCTRAVCLCGRHCPNNPPKIRLAGAHSFPAVICSAHHLGHLPHLRAEGAAFTCHGLAPYTPPNHTSARAFVVCLGAPFVCVCHSHLPPWDCVPQVVRTAFALLTSAPPQAVRGARSFVFVRLRHDPPQRGGVCSLPKQVHIYLQTRMLTEPQNNGGHKEFCIGGIT